MVQCSLILISVKLNYFAVPILFESRLNINFTEFIIAHEKGFVPSLCI